MDNPTILISFLVLVVANIACAAIAPNNCSAQVVLFQKQRKTGPITQGLSISESKLVYNVALVIMSFSCQTMYITMITHEFGV